jgi:hypothetical protein
MSQTDTIEVIENNSPMLPVPQNEQSQPRRKRAALGLAHSGDERR